jgi:CheY-like chemotaxis protein
MLIDDNDIDNYIANHVVTKSGIADKISLMSSAVEALQNLETVKEDFDQFPDLIFLDISMPIMDGFGFLNEVSKFPKVIDNRCDVVVLTSSSNTNDIERAMQYSVVKEYFVKPLKMDMLDLLLNKNTF